MSEGAQVGHKEDILKLEQFELAKYEKYALTSLTAYCVFWLHEWSLTPTLENIAVAGHRMFPVKFCMVGWPQFPDMTRINRSVLQMRPKYRNLATSMSAKGVFLNQNGIREARVLIQRIGTPILQGGYKHQVPSEPIRAERGKGSRARSVDPQDLIVKIKKSELFRFYSTARADTAEAIHLIDLLGVYDHTPSSEKKRRLRQLSEAARELKDTRVSEFLAWVSERFHRYLDK